jgi:hypothetical protein
MPPLLALATLDDIAQKEINPFILLPRGEASRGGKINEQHHWMFLPNNFANVNGMAL